MGDRLEGLIDRQHFEHAGQLLCCQASLLLPVLGDINVEILNHGLSREVEDSADERDADVMGVRHDSRVAAVQVLFESRDLEVEDCTISMISYAY